ncbi:MAG: right-handed parallel beta-helix repeat-containing protein [Candidatus Krumholzibacteriota bacterium]|nr:right-handed parallel beta-helix repeat-containing protein [Candidatus Krumholzibacteriota bacterium]
MRDSIRLATALTSLLLVAASSTATATILQVPDDFATIQEAIDASVLWRDTIIVAPGTYTGPLNRHLSTSNPSGFRIFSSNGPDATIIDCEGLDNAFWLTTDTNYRNHIEGFTIKNGYRSNTGGGAIYARLGGHADFYSCYIISNSASGNGGAIYCGEDGNLYFDHCTIAGNQGGLGGGIYCEEGGVNLSFCSVTGNLSTEGGGLFLRGGADIQRCTFAGNQAQGTVGGIYLGHRPSGSDGAIAHIDNTIVFGNSGLEVCTDQFSQAIMECCCISNTETEGYIVDDDCVHADPLFCDFDEGWPAPHLEGDYTLHADSPCLPLYNPCWAYIGAYGQGCGAVAIKDISWTALKALYE